MLINGTISIFNVSFVRWVPFLKPSGAKPKRFTVHLTSLFVAKTDIVLGGSESLL